MKIFLFSCVATTIMNYSSEAWKTEDNANMQIAQKRCGELYSDAPCLKKFIKKEPRTYNAICGAEK